MTHYSSELKESMVAKLCMPGAPSVYQLSAETGISSGSLYNWVKAYGEGVKMGKSSNQKNWSPEEKLKAVIEAQGLSEQALGEYLRKNGLHSLQIEEWKTECIATLGAANDRPKKNKPGRPKKDPELVKVELENKMLKRNLRRKDKALAEQTALVILQKKAEILWGSYEDDEEEE